MTDDNSTPSAPLMAAPGREPTDSHKRPDTRFSETNGSQSDSFCRGSRPNEISRPQIGGWWWWELGAVMLSLLSAALLIPVLLKVDNLPVEKWPYAILPNTLLSILTIVTKTAMMVPIAACLSQMKWDHFQHRPNPLDHLQLYDDASRGPWGSFVLLVTGRLKVLSAWAFALVTLVALGMEPSIQQTIETRTKFADMTNTTALIGLAYNYSSRAFISSSFQGFNGAPHEPNLHTLELQTSILNGAAGSPPIVDFHCPEPATDCSWDDFDTLAVCGSFQNVTGTDAYNRTCKGSYCTYEFPDSLPMTLLVDGGATGSTSLFNSTSNAESTTLWAVKTNSTTSVTEAYAMSWKFCKKTFRNLTASPSGHRAANVTTKELVLFAEDSLYAGLNPSYAYYKEPESSSPYFNVSISVDRGLFSYITTLFTRELRSATRQQAVKDSLNLAEYMYLTDLSKLTADIANTLTAQLRSASKDNTMATTVEGRARYRETYYHVRWLWILVTFAEVFATAVLLGVSIVLTRRQPLLKASSFALLAFDLHGWTDEEVQGKEASKDLTENSERMWARFGHDEEGYLKFLRSDGAKK